MKERFTLIAATYLLLRKGNEVLLLRRFQTGYEDGKYSLVAGHIDGNETLKEAMIREAKEEAGIIVMPYDLHLVHVMHRKTDSERMDFFFVCDTWNGDIINAEPEKCDDLRWFDVSHLPKNTIPYVKKAIDASISGDLYSEVGWPSS